MRVSAKGDYACRAMLDIVLNRSSDRPVQIREIALRQNVPVKFLEQILVALKRDGLLESRRGPGGGYLLAKPPSAISVADVLRATDGPLFTSECALLPGDDPAEACPLDAHCVFRSVWASAAAALAQSLASADFEELARRHISPEAAAYCI